MTSKTLSRDDLTAKAKAKIELLRRKSKKFGFTWFVYNVFSLSFDEFVSGKYIEDACRNMEANRYTMDVTARDHFKSTRNYAEIMFHIFTEEKAWEGHFLSFSKDMAKYHLRKITALIEANPAFQTMHNHKSLSEFMLIYSRTPFAPKMMILPKGLNEFKRGIHSEAIYVDDAYKDVDQTQEIDPTTIRKINEVVTSQILPMVKKGGICRIVGTPQTDDDFFFNPEMQKKFVTRILPAIVDRETKTSIWPEWMSYQDLADKEELMGHRQFSREYLARPIRSANSYIEAEVYEAAEKGVSWKYADHRKILANQYVVAGFDIGKKRHPSHLAIFIKTYIEIKQGRKRESVPRYAQIYSEWFDHVNYSKQIEKLNQICEWFNISMLRYDNTRSEFESYAEENQLHYTMQPVVFTAKQKSIMATTMEQLFDTKRIILVKDHDERQAKQFLSVNANLEASESPLGHGDSFWSIGLAVSDSEDIIQARST